MHCFMDKCPSFARNTELETRLTCLTQELDRILKENERLVKENTELKARLSQDSSNSSKPPSSDGYRKKPKPVSLRKKSGRKTGGQPGHPGKTLEWALTPHRIETHLHGPCECGCPASDIPGGLLMSRQVHDLPPPPKIEVVEHQVFGGACPRCGKTVRGAFPIGVDGPVQYGPRVNSIAIYLAYQQFIPLERATEAMRDLFGVALSEGTIVNMLKRFSTAVKKPVDRIWELLRDSDLVHFDETGMRANGRLRWLHLASTKLLTYYYIHGQRGDDAFKEIGLLPLFKGKAVHDFWKPYLIYDDIVHCLCVAHLLRKLKMAHEQYGELWAGRMISLLVSAHDMAKNARAEGFDALALDVVAMIDAEYDVAVRQGLAENGFAVDHQLEGGRRGAPQSKPVNLPHRFQEWKEDILRFAKDLSVPFDNNLAERDVRMCKLRAKISGGFRGKDEGSDFSRLRSYFSTVKKNAINILDAIVGALAGKPFMPDTDST